MRHALKEWPAAISALETGEMIVLFRKGGIHDNVSSFNLPAKQAFLFPSFEHQKLSMLKSPQSNDVAIAPYGSDDKIAIHSWVEFKELIEIKAHILATDISPFHIWTDEFFNQRRSWKPERTLYAVVCFTYRLHKPIEIAYKKQYGGCKSWIDLETEIALPKSTSIHTEPSFCQSLETLRNTLT